MRTEHPRMRALAEAVERSPEVEVRLLAIRMRTALTICRGRTLGRAVQAVLARQPAAVKPKMTVH